MLLERPGEVVGREELRKRLWPNDTVVEFEHSISAAMNRLRQALGDSANNPTYIETLARRGYRWLCAVEHLENPAVASRLLDRDAAGPLSDISAISTTETSGEEVLPNRSRNPIAWIVAAVLALALGGLALVHFREPVPRHQRIRFQMNQPEGQLCLIQLSPDGRWMAYVGEQFPRAQVFVESVPRGKGRWQISTEGGDWPIWRRDGKELFYRQGTQIMAVPIQLSATSVKSGAPEALFDVLINTRFQVSRDGQRFLIAVPADNSGTLTMDTDWKAGLPQLK